MTAVKYVFKLVLAVALAVTLYPGCTPGGAPPTEHADSASPAPAAPAASTGSATAGDPVAAIAEPPAMPMGYGSTIEVMAAIANGRIPLLDDNPPLPDGVKELAGLEYGNIDGVSLELDLALPANGEGPFPGLIFIHGGGWASGKRQVYHLYTYYFAQQGYAAATISYRLSGQAKFPAAVQDVKCAVRWMRANAAAYHIDPDRIALIGGSAGVWC
ncbi:MAG TPA: alpha/beta hydrolase, partial [Candidatus Hydrogenedentes bacterium]|nr:alpha/beta hydrolase [Candidatus Hydrogenedentota bacterium]